MREIKFRAWDVNEKRWLTCDEYCEIGINPILDKYGNGFDLNDSTYENGDSIAYNIEFVEYTGLRDRNNVEIYEGDILPINDDENGVVEWGDSDGAWILGDWLLSRKSLEVIGNIYENKELLECPEK